MRNNPWTGRHPGRRRNPWVVRKELEAAVQQQEAAREALFAAGWKPTMATLPAINESHFLRELLDLNAANVAVTEKRMELRRRRR